LNVAAADLGADVVDEIGGGPEIHGDMLAGRRHQAAAIARAAASRAKRVAAIRPAAISTTALA
jgi:hypothetical protein